VIDQTNSLIEPLQRKLNEKYRLPDGQPNYILRNMADPRFPVLEDLKKYGNEMVANGVMSGYLLIGHDLMDSNLVEYRSKNVGNIRDLERFSNCIREVVTEKKLIQEGMDPLRVKRLSSSIEVKTIKLTKSGEEEESGIGQIFFTAYLFIMMLMMLIMTSGQILVRSVIEEKSNRIIEILVSSCSATDLMIGKILGLSALGLTQIGFWFLMAAAVSLQFGVALISFSSVPLILVYFVLGYILYAAIFVTVGAPLTTEQEAQQFTGYLSIILVTPIAFAFVAIQNPEALWIKILSFFPLLTPTLMVLRIPISMPPLWEIIGTIAVLLGSSIFMMWAAGKIFRLGILITGKRPTIREIVHWLQRA
jgi:ABC-2 type transport system permease protein